MIFSSSYPICPSNLPCTESHLSRWASVCVSVRSFTATTRSTCFCDMARRTLRPMRPKPLIAKLAIGKGLKVEELNRYAEKAQGPTPKRRLEGGRLACPDLATGAVALQRRVAFIFPDEMRCRGVSGHDAPGFYETHRRYGNENYPGFRRQFVRRLHAKTQRSLPGFTCKKVACRG